MPKASIIIPAYNAEKYIGETLDSVLAQTFSDFECLVVDDGSSDRTVEVVESYGDPRIRLFKKSNSGGPAKPRNIGLENSRGEYIFIFDADDIMAAGKLFLSINALDSYPNADMLFSNFSSIDENGNIIKPDFLADYDSFWSLVKGPLPRDGSRFIAAEDIYASLIRVNFIGTSSVALRSAKVKNKFEFDENLSNGDDYLFWVVFLKSHNAIYLNSPLHSYRIQKNSISSRSYLKRGPSRISAILQIQSTCKNRKLMPILSEKLAKEYCSMAYAYKKEGNFKRQRQYALKSLSEKLSVVAVKLLVQSFLARH